MSPTACYVCCVFVKGFTRDALAVCCLFHALCVAACCAVKWGVGDCAYGSVLGSVCPFLGSAFLVSVEHFAFLIFSGLHFAAYSIIHLLGNLNTSKKVASSIAASHEFCNGLLAM